MNRMHFGWAAVLAAGCQLVSGAEDFRFDAPIAGAGGEAGASSGGAGGEAGAGGASECVGIDDCAVGAACIAGRCVALRAGGESCALAAECQSGFCVDGVCCDAECGASCQACTAALTGEPDGVCAPIPAGEDPELECIDAGAASCGATGEGCNGDARAPGCILYPAGTACAEASCSTDVENGPAECDGQGSCVPSTVTPCAPYVCDDQLETCFTSCVNNTQCQASHFCGPGICEPKKIDGQSCNNGSQCLSGFCVEGVCCDTGCGGQCRSCRGQYTNSADGTCDFITAGLDPYHECNNLLAPNCNGNGGCT